MSVVETTPRADHAWSFTSESFTSDLEAARPELLASIRRRLARNSSDAEDICQETLTKAWVARDRYDPARPLAPWLFTIARRVAIDDARRHHPERDGDQEPLERLTDPDLEPADLAGRSELRKSIDGAATTLSPRYRRVLQLRFVDGLSYRSIAEHEKTTEAAVKPLLSRARRQFCDAYAATGAPTRVTAWVLAALASIKRTLRIGGATNTTTTATTGTVAALSCCAATVALVVALGSPLSNGHARAPSPSDVTVSDQTLSSGSQSNDNAPSIPGPVDSVTSQPTPDRSTTDKAEDEPVPLPPAPSLETDLEITRDRVTVTDEIDPDPDNGSDSDAADGEVSLRCVDPDAGLGVSCELIKALDELRP